MDNYCFRCGRSDRHSWGSRCGRPPYNPSPSEEEMDAQLYAELAADKTPTWVDHLSVPVWVHPWDTPKDYIGLRVRIVNRGSEVVGYLREFKEPIKHVRRGGYRVGEHWYDFSEWQLGSVETPPAGWSVRGTLGDGRKFVGLIYVGGVAKGMLVHRDGYTEFECDFRELRDVRYTP